MLTHINENSHKIICDLCGGTGSWSHPYAEAGYDRRIITLPEYDIRNYQPPHNVYGILAAPPCTMFSLARTRAKTPRDFKQGMELVIACLRIIWQSQYDSKIKFWAIENPLGYLRRFLGQPRFTFDPCDFGDRYTKRTDLWGRFNIPILNPVKLNQYEMYLCSQNIRKLPSISDFTGSTQADKRAITPPGFARAFYEANK